MSDHEPDAVSERAEHHWAESPAHEAAQNDAAWKYLREAIENEAVRRYLNGLYCRLGNEYEHDWQETNIGDILMDDMRKYAIDVDYDYRLYPDEGETEEGETEEDKPG